MRLQAGDRRDADRVPALDASRLTYRAVWAYPWDLVDRGVEECVGEIASLGFTAVSAAAVYHPVQAFLPENPRRRWFVEARSHSNYESLGAVAGAVSAAGLDLTAWLVLFNSTLASERPELAVRPLGGPPQPSLLCPANPAVREYAVGLAREVDERFAPAALDLETVGWGRLPQPKIGVPLSESARYLVSLCFCDACRRLAGGASEPPLADSGELAAFQSAREQVVLELVREIAESVSARVHVIHWGDARTAGFDFAALASVADRLVVLDYARTGAIAAAARAAGPDRIVAGLSLCAPETPDEATFACAVTAAAAAGVEELSVYNHSLVDRGRLRWAAVG